MDKGEYECQGACDGYDRYPCILCVYHTPKKLELQRRELERLRGL